MRNVLILLIIIILYGCSNRYNKSIFSPLTEQELSEITKNDSSFSYVYSRMQETNKTLVESDMKKYENLTYQDIMNFMNFDLGKEWADSITLEWKHQYGDYRRSVNIDSISDFWKRQQEEMDPNKYVNIEFLGFNRENTKIYGKYMETEISFKIIPTNGNLDGVDFSWSLDFKKDKKNRLHYFVEGSSISYTKPIYHPISIDKKINYILFEYEGMTDNQIVHYILSNDVDISIDRVYKDNELISNKVPESIVRYWKCSDSVLVNYYIDKIIEDLIDDSFVPEAQYIKSQIDAEFYQRFPIVFDYLRQIGSI